MGGSQGASVLSRVVPRAMAGLGLPVQVTQQCREADLAAGAPIYQQANIAAELAPYFQDVPTRLSRANLVIARAGASTIAELTASVAPRSWCRCPARWTIIRQQMRVRWR